MREFKYGFLPVVCLFLVCVASSLWTVDARKNGNPTKPSKTKARSRTSQQNAEQEAARARADLKRLERQREAEAWEYAVRAYPNGIPEGARTRALEAINEMKVRAAATRS